MMKDCNFSPSFRRTLACSYISTTINVIPRGGRERSGQFSLERRQEMRWGLHYNSGEEQNVGMNFCKEATNHNATCTEACMKG